MSPSPAELQRTLAECILRGERAPLESWIAVPDGVDPDVRLGVYANGYPARIRESLCEAYPALRKLLGAATFATLAHRYLPHVPAEESNLNRVGSALPDFLRDDSLARELAFVPDLARLEWAVLTAFHACLDAPFAVARFDAWAPQDWARARVAFQPGVAVVRSRWPIAALRECRDTPRDEIDVDLEDHPESVLVHRSGLDVVIRTLGATQSEALERLLAGEPLGAVVDRLAEHGDDAQAVASQFTAWASAGIISDLHLP